MSHSNTAALLNRIEEGHSPGKEEIIRLLKLTDPDDVGMMFDTAARIRARHFGNRVFFYAFLYFSTFCRNDCLFCQYRRSHTRVRRYRKTQEEILASAKNMAGSGVHLIDLTLGEDPVWQDRGMEGLGELAALSAQVREETKLPVMISPGVLPPAGVDLMAEKGLEWYACYQETHNRDLFARLRPGQDFDQRFQAKQAAKSKGMLVEEGILTGVGETPEDMADSILAMKTLGADQARVMTFVPQKGTPMAGVRPRGRTMELRVIALLRMVLKDCLIPASLDVEGLGGLGPRLRAGANVVTSIVPPDQGLAGVANPSLDIETSRRTPDLLMPVLASLGLEPGTQNAYREWMSRRAEIRASLPN